LGGQGLNILGLYLGITRGSGDDVA